MNAISERIAAVLALDSEAPAIEFDGRWSSWGRVDATACQVGALVSEPGCEVGILLRNRPASIGLLLGVLRAGGCVVTINPGRGRERTRADVAALDLPIVCGEPEDLAELVPSECRALRVGARALGEPLEIAEAPGERLDPAGEISAAPAAIVGAAHARPGAGRPGVAVRMLTSGTTGPPKRVDLAYRTLERVLAGARYYESNRDDAPRLRKGVAIVNAPLVHLGGVFRVLQCVFDGRSFALLEKFTVERWADAVRRHRPATASLVPAALRMVLEAGLPPADLASLRSVVSGTAPLDPDDADAFTARYGIPVLVNYAATEFAGSVAGWNVDDHRRFWSRKRGSVGRVLPGCALRVVDEASGTPRAAGEPGLLEVQADSLGAADWVRTTDLARIDEEGFVWILGRADHAIIRGGFKVLPDEVKRALERHPAVRGAVVVGRADPRLGEVPVAAVELRAGGPAVDAEALLAYAATVLSRYEIPVELRVVDALPRTDSGKVDLPAVRALLGADARAGAAPDAGTRGS